VPWDNAFPEHFMRLERRDLSLGFRIHTQSSSEAFMHEYAAIQCNVVQSGPLSSVLAALESSPTVSYILDSQHRIIHCNPAWDRFAKSNGAPDLTGDRVIGSDVFDATPDVLKKFYDDGFQTAIDRGIWEVSYECSSPDLFRKYRMRVHCLGRTVGFIVTNSLIYESHHRRPRKPDTEKYVQANGLVTMCAHCRRSQRVDRPDQWDFVSHYLRLKGTALLTVSHSFCPICHAYYYPA
jgi:hypothetical protein